MKIKSHTASWRFWPFHSFPASAHPGQIQSPGKPMGDFRELKRLMLSTFFRHFIRSRWRPSGRVNMESYHKPLEFAIERPLSISTITQGVWTQLEGHRVWRAHVISPGQFHWINL